MTKHIFRIVVTLLIVSTLGYVAWSFFLKPDNNEHVYNEMLSVVTQMDENEVSKFLSQINSKNYYGTDAEDVEKQLSAAVPLQAEILKMRKFAFGIENINDFQMFYGVNADFVHYQSTSYDKFEFILKSALNYYVPFTQFATGVNSEDIKGFNLKQENLNKSYEAVLSKANEILEFQKNTVNPNTTTDNVLNGFYKGLLHNITVYYGNYADLVIYVKNFVAERATNGDFVYDIFPIYYNSSVYSIKHYTTTMNFLEVSFAESSLSSDEIAKNQYLFEALTYAINYELYFNNVTTQPVNFDLINNYNTLSANYSEILFGTENIFTRSNANKRLVINNDGAQIASIRVAYITNVQNLLSDLLNIEPDVIEEQEPEGEDEQLPPGGIDVPELEEY